jgi:NAD(P)-dependent dehydrogenase (short-subunit alcohol dehydrogenase family)
MTSFTYNRVWFITGSAGRLGRALAEAVLARGEQAVVTDRTPERVRDMIERYPAQALVLELDVTRPEQVRAAVSQATDRFGRIDVLVNAAVEGFSEPLAQEVAPLGIKVIVVEPDDAPTAGTDVDLVCTLEGRKPSDPARAAEAIIAALDADIARTVPQK